LPATSPESCRHASPGLVRGFHRPLAECCPPCSSFPRKPPLRSAYEQEGELSAAIEVRRLFAPPGPSPAGSRCHRSRAWSVFGEQIVRPDPASRLPAYPEWRYSPGAGCRIPFGSTLVPELLGASRSRFLLGVFAEPVVGAEVAHPATATPTIPSTTASIPFKEVPAQIMTRAFHGFGSAASVARALWTAKADLLRCVV
jgi:hypothetical protein